MFLCFALEKYDKKRRIIATMSRIIVVFLSVILCEIANFEAVNSLHDIVYH